MRCARMRAGRRELLGALDLFPQFDELFTRRVLTELRELLSFFIMRVVPQLLGQLADQRVKPWFGRWHSLELLHDLLELLVLFSVVLHGLFTIGHILAHGGIYILGSNGHSDRP
jgi:hypothetical protein